jgi:hypothetical protein
VLTEVEGFQGESWTIQVEIVEQELLGALSADEEPVLVLNENGTPPPQCLISLVWVSKECLHINKVIT